MANSFEGGVGVTVGGNIPATDLASSGGSSFAPDESSASGSFAPPQEMTSANSSDKANTANAVDLVVRRIGKLSPSQK